jgi:hypothetical protein
MLGRRASLPNGKRRCEHCELRRSATNLILLVLSPVRPFAGFGMFFSTWELATEAAPRVACRRAKGRKRRQTRSRCAKTTGGAPGQRVDYYCEAKPVLGWKGLVPVPPELPRYRFTARLSRTQIANMNPAAVQRFQPDNDKLGFSVTITKDGTIFAGPVASIGIGFRHYGSWFAVVGRLNQSIPPSANDVNQWTSGPSGNIMGAAGRAQSG